MGKISVEALREGKSFISNGHEVCDEGFFALNAQSDGSVKRIKICEAIFIENVIKELDTGEHYIILVSKVNGEYIKRMYRMDVLMPQNLLKLMKYGIAIPSKFEHMISRYLLRLKEELEPINVFSNVGWHEDDKSNLEFRLETLISDDLGKTAMIDNQNLKFNVTCGGTLEAWIDMCKKEVIGNIPLETALCFGFSAPIVGYLYRKKGHQDTLLMHLVGNSTTGKTTASNLAVSAFGPPDSNNQGLSRTWNGTTNAIIRSLGGNFGVPLVLDEFSMVRNKSVNSEVYTIVDGQDKARLTDTIEQRDRPKWATTVISTGEQSIFNKTSNNAGLRVRVLQFDGVRWTNSAQNADNIKSVISENYGHAGVEFVKYIFSKGTYIIDEKMKYWNDKCINKIPNNPFKDRIAYKYAIIMAGGDIANEALDLGMDLDKVLDFLVDNENDNMLDRDLAEKAFNDVIELTIQNMSKFIIKGICFSPKDCWGKINISGGYYKVVFLKNILEKQLTSLGYEDAKVVIREWKQKGYLTTEKDKTTKRLIVDSNKRENVYELKIPMNELKDYIPKPSFLNS